MSKVKVVTFLDGQLIMDTSNPDVSLMRVEQEKEYITPDGWFDVQNRSALIKGPREKLEARFKEGQVLPGTIYHKEQLEPFYDGQDPKMNPSTGEILTVDGKEIYRQSFYTPNAQAEDHLIQHDRVAVTATANVENETVGELAS